MGVGAGVVRGGGEGGEAIRMFERPHPYENMDWEKNPHEKGMIKKLVFFR